MGIKLNWEYHLLATGEVGVKVFRKARIKLNNLPGILWGWRPVTRARMDREQARKKQEHWDHVNNIRKDHEKEMDEAAKAIKNIIDRCSHIRFKDRRELGDEYVIQISFMSGMMTGYPRHGEIEFIAQQVGRNVEHEISSLRFLEPAAAVREREMRRRDDCRP